MELARVKQNVGGDFMTCGSCRPKNRDELGVNWAQMIQMEESFLQHPFNPAFIKEQNMFIHELNKPTFKNYARGDPTGIAPDYSI